ncbi:MAG: hypothetical protein JNL82_19520 [Myxococcales bacterium]|nr:hypothetical protein [Myxococcales bacterium]
MSADDLIAALQGGLRVDSEGSFTLHRDKAREKLRTFQVAEPQRYVLSLMALASLKGATAVTVTIDSDDVVVRFDGAPVTAADLDDLYGSSFSAASTDVQRARQQLALAIHAALALNPRFVRVVSGAGESAVSLLARHGVPDEIGGAAAASGGTEVHVKQRFRPGLLVRFVQHLRGSLAEATWLRERCRFSSRAITVNGEAVARGLALEGATHAFSHGLGPSRGVAGLVAEPGPAVIRLVRHGVWLHDVEAPELPLGLVVVIADDLLLTDLSGDKVVQDEHYARCMALALALAGSVLHAAVGADEVEPAPELARRLAPVWRHPDVADPGAPIGSAMARVIRFRDIFGRRHSLARLRRVAAEQGFLPTTRGAYADRLPRGDGVVIQLAAGRQDDDEQVLARLFAGQLCDVSEGLERAAQVELNRRRWRAQPCEPRLTAASYHLVEPFEVGLGGVRVVGEIGLRRAPTTTCSLRVVVDGCLLAELELAGPIAGVDAVIGGPLPIKADFSGPHTGELLAACLGAWLASARALAETAVARGLLWDAPAPREAFAHGYLRSLYRSEALRALLGLVGYDERAITATMRQLLRALAPRPTPPRLHRERWLQGLWALEAARGERLDVAAIGALLEQDVKLRWVPDACARHPAIAEPVLYLRAREVEVVRWLFGGRVERMRDEAYAGLLARARFFARPEATSVLSEETCTPHVVATHAGLRIGAAFEREERGWLDHPRRAACELVVHGRLLGEGWIAAPVPGVRFAIVGEGLTINATWDGVVVDDAFRAAARAAALALPELVRGAVAAATAHAGPREVWLRGVAGALTATFPTPGLRRACALLVAEYGAADGQARYMRLLAWQVARSLRQLDALTRDPDVDAKVLGDVGALAQRLGAAAPDEATVATLTEALAAVRAALGQVGGASWLEDVGRCAPEVAALPLLRREDGTPVTLAQLAAQAAGRSTCLVIDPEDATWPHQARARLLADERTLALVRALYDEAALRVPASVDEARSFATAEDLLRLLEGLREQASAPRAAVRAIPALLAAAVAGCRREDAAAPAWRRALLLALGATFPAPLLRAKYRVLRGALGAEAAEAAYCKLLARAQVDGMTAVIEGAMGKTERALLAEVEGPESEASEGVRQVLAALRAGLGQVGGASLLESVVRLSPEVRELPLFERVDGARVRVGEVVDAAARGELHVDPDAPARARPPAYLRALRVTGEAHEVLMGWFGSERLSTRAPPTWRPPDGPSSPPELPRRASAPAGVEAREPEWLARARQLDIAALTAEAGPPDRDADIREVFAGVRRGSGPHPKAGPVRTRAPDKPPEPTPADRLVAAVQGELHALRRGHESLLTGFNLDHVRAAAGSGRQAVRCGREGVVLDTRHPHVAAAVAGFAGDRVWISFLVSQVYTALNVWREDITDAHEEAFHARHLAWLRGELTRHA